MLHLLHVAGLGRAPSALVRDDVVVKVDFAVPAPGLGSLLIVHPHVITVFLHALTS
jgi:hypothetical protein